MDMYESVDNDAKRMRLKYVSSHHEQGSEGGADSIGVRPDGAHPDYYLKLATHETLYALEHGDANTDNLKLVNMLLEAFPKKLEGSVFTVDLVAYHELTQGFLYTLIGELCLTRKASLVIPVRCSDKMAKKWNSAILWEYELTPAKNLTPFDPNSCFYDPSVKNPKAMNLLAVESSLSKNKRLTRRDLNLLAKASQTDLVKAFHRPGAVQQSETFVSPFPTALYKKIFLRSSSVYMAFSLSGAMSIFPLMLLGHSLAETTLIGAAGVAACATITGIYGSRYLKARKVGKEINSIVSERLRLWLASTHGIKVNSEITTKMSAAISEQLSDPEKKFSFSFESPALKGLALKVGKDGFFVKGKKFDPSLTKTLQTKMQKFQESDSLSVPVQALVNEITDISKALGQETITVESQHIKDRVEEDMTTTLDMHAKLRRLGGAESEKDNLVSIITALRDEMKQVLYSEAQAVKKEMAIQEIYVKSRDSETGIRLEGPTNNL